MAVPDEGLPANAEGKRHYTKYVSQSDLLKTELFYLEEFDSVDQLEKAIIEDIDYYNNRRIKLKLNGLSPVQYRIQTVQAA